MTHHLESKDSKHNTTSLKGTLVAVSGSQVFCVSTIHQPLSMSKWLAPLCSKNNGDSSREASRSYILIAVEREQLLYIIPFLCFSIMPP